MASYHTGSNGHFVTAGFQTWHKRQCHHARLLDEFRTEKKEKQSCQHAVMATNCDFSLICIYYLKGRVFCIEMSSFPRTKMEGRCDGIGRNYYGRSSCFHIITE